MVRTTKRGSRIIPTKAPVVFEPRASESSLHDLSRSTSAADWGAVPGGERLADPLTEYEYAELTFEPMSDKRRKAKVCGSYSYLRSAALDE